VGDVWAIVVAGGLGRRFGDATPKQFSELAGLRLIDWALSAAGAACHGVVAVLPAAHLGLTLPPGVRAVAGGATRSGSVRAGADGAVPGVAVPDTVKRIDPATGQVLETPDRAALRAIQTPQAFTASVLRRAHAGGGDATDDAALVEALGGTVVVVDGDPANLKITAPGDLVRAEVLLDRRDA
jgi:2-C-methyl-D-erythritol 4-phosphate cytidylyltransferase